MVPEATPVIAIISDFGDRDWFVGSMKGMIRKSCPGAAIEVITNRVPSGDIAAASYILASCIHDFPKGTVFLCVVDPGVGTEREAIVGRIGNYTVVCPNNGLVSDCLQNFKNEVGVFYHIISEKIIHSGVSSTFHGRDIFAPVAGKISAGEFSIDELGPPIKQLIRILVPKPEIVKGSIRGAIRYIDAFGNGITNIGADQLALFSIKPSAYIEVNGLKILLKNTFAEAEIGQPLTYIGSNGAVEIAVNQGNGAEELALKVGTKVSFYPEEIKK